MGRKLEKSAAAQDVFLEADTALRAFSWWDGISLQDLCFNGPADRLNDTIFAQPAIFTVEVATSKDLASFGRDPAAAVAHSLGEYAALEAVGAISFKDAITAVAQRGRFMKQAAENRPGGMVAVMGLDLISIEKLCVRLAEETKGATVQIANINSPSEVIITGDKDAFGNVEEFASELGAQKVMRLPVTIAGHSELMGPAVEDMKSVINSISIDAPHMPFYSPTTGGRVYLPDAIRVLLIGQLTSRVQWVGTIETMISDGYRAYLEVGSKKALSRFVHEIDPSVEVSATNS